jgi:hypothetical protein
MPINLKNITGTGSTNFKVVSGVGGINFKTPTASSIVTSGLALYLDAGNASSYPGSGTNWNDLTCRKLRRSTQRCTQQ